MDIEKLFSYIDNSKERYIDIISDICNIKSPTDYKEGVDKVGKYFLEFAEKRGWKTKVFPQEVSGDIVSVIINPEAEVPPLTLSAHTDTVYTLGMFDDFKVSYDDKYIYGPGVADCKGGAAVCLLAMEALTECGFKDRPVQLILQSDEEKNSTPSLKSTINYICEESKNSVAFLNCEPGVKNTASLQRKGIIRYVFKIKGKAAHSALCYNGANAVCEAARKILLLEEWKSPDGITCNCGQIKGGSAANTVAEYCEFTADIRFSTEEELSFIRKETERIKNEIFVSGCITELEEISYRPEMEKSDLNYQLLDKLNNIFKSNGLEELAPRKANGGSDAAYVTKAKIPCIDSVGIVGSKIHSVNEYAEIESIIECAKKIALAAIFL